MKDLKKVWFIYDDRVLPQTNIINIVGSSSFGEILHKRVKLQDKIKSQIKKKMDIKESKYVILKSDDDLLALESNLISSLEDQVIFVHIMSYAVILNVEDFELAIKKSAYSDHILVTNTTNPLIYFSPNINQYLELISQLDAKKNIDNEGSFSESHIIRPNDYVLNISYFQNFLQFFSGGFEARYFNSLKGDDFTLTKTSTDKKKIKKEHDLYNLLPNQMKNWFVAPFNLIIEDNTASYTMERLNIPDMALQWIHGAITPSDLEKFLDKIFYFIEQRPKRYIDSSQYFKVFEDLYYIKVFERIEALKKLPQFENIRELIKTGTPYNTIDEILEEYKTFYQIIYELKKPYEVIGHGDLCFSNMLYDKNTNIIKLIDPKGATNEQELWTNPYYDIAKLSHSIFGSYDFITNEMFSISIDSNIQLELNLDVTDISLHQEIFRNKLESHGYDIFLIRTCEASLFISMLPLHIDNPRKVLALLLNAINILKELKTWKTKVR